jgi:hypothetical protein
MTATNPKGASSNPAERYSAKRCWGTNVGAMQEDPSHWRILIFAFTLPSSRGENPSNVRVWCTSLRRGKKHFYRNA